MRLRRAARPNAASQSDEGMPVRSLAASGMRVCKRRAYYLKQVSNQEQTLKIWQGLQAVMAEIAVAGCSSSVTQKSELLRLCYVAPVA